MSDDRWEAYRLHAYRPTGGDEAGDPLRFTDDITHTKSAPNVIPVVVQASLMTDLADLFPESSACIHMLEFALVPRRVEENGNKLVLRVHGSAVKSVKICDANTYDDIEFDQFIRVLEKRREQIRVFIETVVSEM